MISAFLAAADIPAAIRAGVSVENEVIVTPTGYRLLTAAFPRKIADVEAWVAESRQDRSLRRD